MLKRTFFWAVIFSAILMALAVLFVQEEARPFTPPQMVLLAVVSFLPGFGFAFLFDPYSKKKKEEYLRIDFYQEED